MAGARAYGISTRLYRSQRLCLEYLREIRAADFPLIELDAIQTHVDYHHDRPLAELQQWMAEAGVSLASVHAPIAEGFVGGRPVGPLYLDAADAAVRAHALQETERALHIARRIPFRVFVVHIGSPKGSGEGVRGSREGARRSLEALQKAADPLGVRLAIELRSNDLSEPGALVHFLDEVLDVASAGICLDLGRGHLTGNLVDAIETVSEHVLAVDVHDNRGRTDDHLVPFDGTIDWGAALTTLQKVGYDGPLMFELQARGATRDTLARARQARQQMDRLLAE